MSSRLRSGPNPRHSPPPSNPTERYSSSRERKVRGGKIRSDRSQKKRRKAKKESERTVDEAKSDAKNEWRGSDPQAPQ
jgi:hypothetical protein